MIYDFFVIVTDDALPVKHYFTYEGGMPQGMFSQDIETALKFYDKKSAEQFRKKHLSHSGCQVERKEIGNDRS